MLNNSVNMTSMAIIGASPNMPAAVMSGKRREQELLFEETLNQYHPMISRVVSSYERNKALQEELYQEISMALWKALAQFNQQSALKTYVLSICHKRAVSHVAKYAKEPFQVEIEDFDFVGEDCPSEKMSKNQKMQKLVRAIHCLGMSDRQLVTLSLEGLSYKETAEILGISVSNVGAKLNRAKQKLNQILSQGESND
ncbi:RNA polymerase sigma factor [Aliikangiella sp. IMCC44653]